MVKAYYSILQYVPDAERKEGANIGVILFSEEPRYLDVRLSSSNERLLKLFGRDLNVTDRMVAFYKQSFHRRIHNERGGIETIDDFRKFIETRGNQFALLSPRYIKLSDSPQIELVKLFERLVGQKKDKTRRVSTAILKKKLEQSFKVRGIYQELQLDYEFSSQAFRRTIEFPFAYQNGKTNVIQPVVFNESNYESSACRWSVTAEELKRNDMKLNVFGKFSTNGTTSEARKTVESILHLNDALLRTEEEIEEFTAEIAEAVEKS